MTDAEDIDDDRIEPVPKPIAGGPKGFRLVEASKLIRVGEAKRDFRLTGEGLAVAILDTGINTSHEDFAGRIPVQVNFTKDNGERSDDAEDGHGHGTNVAGIVCAGSLHIGMAHKANVIPLKVLKNADGGGSFAAVEQALDWVIANAAQHDIVAVCMSLGDGKNHTDDAPFAQRRIAAQIKQLRQSGIATCLAAGNLYFSHLSKQGMAYPAILRDCVSVGAVYDRDESRGFTYADGARSDSTGPDRICPFSQRLREKVGGDLRTDIFAPGAPITASGIGGAAASSTQDGTSQAAPVVAGVIVLLQSLYRRLTEESATVDQLVGWLRSSAVEIVDGDDEQDNVLHTGLKFLRIDAFAACEACEAEARRKFLDNHL